GHVVSSRPATPSEIGQESSRIPGDKWRQVATISLGEATCHPATSRPDFRAQPSNFGSNHAQIHPKQLVDP
ncbi:hypothetical protein A2U01_0089015, partial [Trifolium medium]|nr:hypothetical protein [Trifolium medium]